MNPLHIYVMERGMVLIGRARQYERGEDPMFLTLDDVAVIRKWGTRGTSAEDNARGLGMLARKGPTKETILDPEPDGVEINRRAIYRRIPCTEKWSVSWKPTI